MPEKQPLRIGSYAGAGTKCSSFTSSRSRPRGCLPRRGRGPRRGVAGGVPAVDVRGFGPPLAVFVVVDDSDRLHGLRFRVDRGPRLHQDRLLLKDLADQAARISSRSWNANTKRGRPRRRERPVAEREWPLGASASRSPKPQGDHRSRMSQERARLPSHRRTCMPVRWAGVRIEPASRAAPLTAVRLARSRHRVGTSRWRCGEPLRRVPCPSGRMCCRQAPRERWRARRLRAPLTRCVASRRQPTPREVLARASPPFGAWVSGAPRIPRCPRGSRLDVVLSSDRLSRTAWAEPTRRKRGK